MQQIQASDCAFAAILGDGSVVTWGSARFGGDSSAVQRMCNKSKLLLVLLLQSYVMELCSLGGIRTRVATAVPPRSS